MDTTIKHRGTLNNVQAIRAISALLVVIAHLGGLLSSLGLGTKAATSAGIIGTMVFFGISGLIMIYTTAGRPTTPWSFLRQRIVRIVPIYWSVTLAVFLLALTMPALMQATRADLGELVYSLAFIPFQKINGLAEPLLFVGWTLNYEMFFYMLFAIGLTFPNRGAGLSAVLLSLLGLVLYGEIASPSSVVGKFYTNPLVLEFGLGMLIGLTLPYLPSRTKLSTRIVVLAVVIISMAGAMVLPYVALNGASVLVCGLPGTVVLFCAVALERWGWQINNASWLLLGDASYSLYLTHIFITQIAEKVGARLHSSGALSLAIVVLAIIGSCLLGVLIFRTVERPLWYAARRAFIPAPVSTRPV